MWWSDRWSFCFFFNDTATTEIYTLSLHDALPISDGESRPGRVDTAVQRVRGDLPRRRDHPDRRRGAAGPHPRTQDRKSTRLNSSHANISYAVFCLKKKNRTAPIRAPFTSSALLTC